MLAHKPIPCSTGSADGRPPLVEGERKGRQGDPLRKDWSELNELICDLGAVRAAADTARASGEAKAAIEAAIRSAAEAVDLASFGSGSRRSVSEARRLIKVANQAIAGLAIELARASAARAKASQQIERAARLATMMPRRPR
jgi:hypothetical protein